MSNSSVDAVLAVLRDLSLDLEATSPETFGYDRASLCCLDAVLSINRPYKRFVEPRIARFRKDFPQIGSLRELIALIQSLGSLRFGEDILHYRDHRRVNLILAVACRLLEISSENGSPEIDEMTALRRWSNRTKAQDFKSFGVRGIGIATFQYMRMLLGTSTVKPDVHIKSFLGSVLGRRVSDLEAIEIVEICANRLEVPSTTLDHAIWRLTASQPKEVRPEEVPDG